MGSNPDLIYANSGTALIVHAAADDMKTDPAGNLTDCPAGNLTDWRHGGRHAPIRRARVEERRTLEAARSMVH
jgi:hypothetical protein